MTSRRARIAAAVAIVALAAAALAVALGSTGGDPTSAASAGAGPTVVVQRRDLVISEDVSGTLGFGKADPILAGIPGTITTLPEEGAKLSPGDVVYRIDGAPVVLLDGAQPMWRTIEAGIPDGDDIRQLERNLRALGHDAGGALRVDRRFDFATRAAIQGWQRTLGIEPTGRVEQGQVIFQPGPRRVGELAATVGAQVTPGTPLLATTSTKRIVSIALDASDQAIAEFGEPVEVELPDGRAVQGKISFVGRVAKEPKSTTAAGSGDTSPTIDVRVSVAGNLKAFDEAPVSVRIASERKSNVLAVPATALVPVPGDRYALDVIREDGAHDRVPVETGMFANGYVEIHGAAISAGTVVADAPQA